MYAFLSPSASYMSYTSHPLWLYHSNYIRRRVQIMKLLFMQFSPTSELIYCQLNPWSGCSWKPTVAKKSGHSPPFIEPESSSLCSQEPFTVSCPAPD
jgi:hypothetical protein